MADYDVGKAFRRIENELISSMISNLQNHRAQETAEGIQWSQWQAKQLQALDAYKRQNKEKFSGKFAAINENISKSIQEAYNTGGMEQEIKILKAIEKGYTGSKRKFNGATNTKGEFFKVNERKLNALVNSTTHDMQKAESAVLRMANDKYRKIIFDAQVYANAGGTTYEKAVDMATRDFLAAGLNCVEYKNGARHTISDYADMAVRTANKRAYLRGEGTKRAEWGIHTVIVNKRGNACPLCLPFVGMVLIDDVYSGGSSEDGDYTLLSSAMTRGFLHPRCEDNYTTYFEGISTPPKEQKLSRADIEDVEEKQKQEQQKQYAENQAKRMDRLAKYSLNEDNKKLYSVRVAQWRNKANVIDKSVAKSGKNGIINVRSGKMGLSIEIDKFTPCLVEKATGKIVDTQYSVATKNELKAINKQGWNFNWTSDDLRNSTTYKLTLDNDGKNTIQGLIAVTDFPKDKALYINIAESAPHNIGKNKMYEGVGGHLFAIAAKESVNKGYEGFMFLDAKNIDLVKYYHDKFGATLLGMPHPYRMFIDEHNAHKLLKVYTLKGE